MCMHDFVQTFMHNTAERCLFFLCSLVPWRRNGVLYLFGSRALGVRPDSGGSAGCRAAWPS